MTSTAPSPGSPASSLLDLAPVIPVVIVQDVDQAVPLARALVAGGLPVIEVTFRTPAAADAIRAIAEEVPDAVVGAGTVLSPEQVETAVAAGSRFLVTPGWTDRLMGALDASGLPYLPGVSTTSRGRLAAGARAPGDEVLPGGGCRGRRISRRSPHHSRRPASARPAASTPRPPPRSRPSPTSAAWAAPGCCPQHALDALDSGRGESLAREAAALRCDLPG
ncbi:2-dehydro-3-deoxy-phosphogluconate aldolase OS=Streptomyces antimycoticus OX=68175 GN=SANT12839_032050 PE=3 SV=1 [Streptomyces antimycoticus]